MDKSKFLVIIIILFAVTSIVFIILGFQILRVEGDLTEKRIDAYRLSIINLLNRKLDSYITEAEEAVVLKNKIEYYDINALKEAIPQIKELYVLPYPSGKTQSFILNKFLGLYLSRAVQDKTARYFESVNGVEYAVSIVMSSDKKNVTLILMDTKKVLLEMKKEIEELAPSLEAVIVISDINGRILVSSEDITAEQSKLTLSEFKNNFTFWKAGIFARQLEAIEKQREEGIKADFKIFMAVIVIMLITVYFAILVIMREVQTVKMQYEFVSNVSHDLKTPLTSIKMFSEMLQSGKVRSKEKVKNYLNTISIESDRLAFLINNVLEFSKKGKAIKKPELKLIDAADVADESVRIFSPYAFQKGFKIYLKRPREACLVMGDRISLTHAILNLIDNAIKYSQKTKKVFVHVAKEKGNVIISVEDRGIGVSSKEQKKIFDRYYRSEDERVKHIKGIGLGLAIVKQVIDEHKGNLSVDSNENKGSVFSIILKGVK